MTLGTGTKSKVSTRPTGAITLFHPSGEPFALLHARTLTAYRTALASMTLFRRRRRVHNIVVFGTGEQAYWHLRLSLLYGGGGAGNGEIKRITVVPAREGASSTAAASALIARLFAVPDNVKTREGWGASASGTNNGTDVKMTVLPRSHEDYPTLLEKYLRGSDVIYCCTPSRAPLFPATVLTSHEGRRRGRLIIAIGSYTHEMIELPPELVWQAVRRPGENKHSPAGGGAGNAPEGSGGLLGQLKKKRHWHKHAQEGGVLVVDSLDGALDEAGEVRAARLDPGRMVELGEILLLARSACAPFAEAAAGALVEGGAIGPSLRRTMSSNSSSSDNVAADGGADCADCDDDDRTPVDNDGEDSVTTSPSTAGSSGSKLSSKLTGFKRIRKTLSAATRPKNPVEEEDNHNNNFSSWLRGGNVIYKSVGLGVMDLAVGKHVTEVARQRKIGTIVEGF